MPDRLAHAPDLTVAAFVDRELDRRARRALLHQRDGGRRGRAVVEIDAGAQRAELTRGRHAVDLGEIGLGDAVAGMREQLREIAVVGEHEQPLGLVVETTDREDARVVGHELDHRRAPFGIGRGAHVARGLVEEVVDEVVAGRDAHAVDRDHVDGRHRRVGPVAPARRSP